METVIAAGAELTEALADSRILQARREHCAEFRQHLEAGDWAEPEWQGFFEQRTWIFGWGLEYRFLHTLQSRPYFGGRDITRTGGQEGDYLLATAASIRFTVIAEIKRPDSPLVGVLYRNRTYPPGDDLAAGVAQMQQESRRWVVEGSMTEANRELLEGQGIYTNEPRGILVIGNTADLGNDGAKIRSFESFRRHLMQPEVLTFDELLCRAEAIVALSEAAAAGRDPQGPA